MCFSHSWPVSQQLQWPASLQATLLINTPVDVIVKWSEVRPFSVDVFLKWACQRVEHFLSDLSTSFWNPIEVSVKYVGVIWFFLPSSPISTNSIYRVNKTCVALANIRWSITWIENWTFLDLVMIVKSTCVWFLIKYTSLVNCVHLDWVWSSLIKFEDVLQCSYFKYVSLGCFVLWSWPKSHTTDQT